MMSPDFEGLPWDGPDRLDFDGVAVEFCVPPALYERESTSERFVLGKSPAMLRSLLREIGPRAPRRIVDIGVYKGGSVVLLASMQAVAAFPSSLNYAAPKAALVHAAKILAAQWKYVRVNVVAPGATHAR